MQRIMLYQAYQLSWLYHNDSAMDVDPDTTDLF